MCGKDMRMWMVEPETMCRKHLLGEHLELHMLIGTMRKGRSLDGYIRNHLCEPVSIAKRHHALVKEMERRGYHHKSPICQIEVKSLVNSYNNSVRVNVELSRADLHNRCEVCKQNYKKEGIKRNTKGKIKCHSIYQRQLK